MVYLAIQAGRPVTKAYTSVKRCCIDLGFGYATASRAENWGTDLAAGFGFVVLRHPDGAPGPETVIYRLPVIKIVGRGQKSF